MKILTIIPARGGSKGVPRKNIKLLGGKPLIAWTIEAANELRPFVIPFVSTEDPYITERCNGLGAISVYRPPELAQDDTPILPVIQQAIKEIEKYYCDLAGIDLGFEKSNEWILLLQPTTPFRSADDILGAIKLASQGECDSVISVVQVGDHHPARMYRITDGYMDALMPDESTKRRQDLSPLYLRNGAIYLTKRDVIMGGRMWGDKVKPYVMPEERSINIDTMLDWKLAEAMLVRD